jgi:hypothetical protein
MKISKDQISAPIQQQPKQPKQSLDSAIDVGHVPFAVGRHDVSVSVVGTPLDPRINQPKQQKTLSFMQYQTFVQSLSAYKRQIQAMAAATETFVRQLQDFSDCVPQAKIQDSLLVADLDFLIDSSQLLSNAHITWANMLEREVEEPLIASLHEIPIMAKQKQEQNKLKIQKCIQQLHSEEDSSYKLKKKKTRDLQVLQQSLNVRMALADEIKRLSMENDSILNNLSQEHVIFILSLLQKTVESKLECYETIQEGFNKIGTVMDSKQTGYRNRNSFFSCPSTELIPTDLEFLRQTLANF